MSEQLGNDQWWLQADQPMDQTPSTDSTDDRWWESDAGNGRQDGQTAAGERPATDEQYWQDLLDNINNGKVVIPAALFAVVGPEQPADSQSPASAALSGAET